MTQVKDIMKSRPELITADITLSEAARKMELLDCGVLPVGTHEEPEGIITDRDIVLRAVAQDKDVTRETVKDYMSHELFYCHENDSVEDAAKIMHEHHVNRLLVKDTSDKITGILSFGCILRKDGKMGEIHKVLEHTVGKKAA